MITVKIYQTRGSSNLSVVKTYSNIALRMSENFYQIMCCLVSKFVIKKSSLILIICNEFNARCLGVYIFHHLIYYCGNVRWIRDLNSNGKLDLNSLENCA